MIEGYSPTRTEAKEHLERIRRQYEESVIPQIDSGNFGSAESTLKNYLTLLETHGVRMIHEEKGVFLVSAINNLHVILDELRRPTNGRLRGSSEMLREDLAELCKVA
ncbi:MAG: hypothetical protein WC796_05865 [Candidatus Pacearchaeota archaeon]|jgi:hypothetical protein